jgi:hypothetical protein
LDTRLHADIKQKKFHQGKKKDPDESKVTRLFDKNLGKIAFPSKRISSFFLQILRTSSIPPFPSRRHRHI